MEQVILRCTCGGNHFITISLDEPNGAYLFFEGCFCWPGLRGYFRRLWYALRNRDHHNPEALLDRNTSEKVIEALCQWHGRLWQNP